MQKAVFALAAVLIAAPAFAQQPPATPAPTPAAQPPAAPVVRDLAAGIKAQWTTIRRNIAGSLDKMSDADYAFKPQGVAPEVRSYGALLAHLVNGNYGTCTRAKGDQPKPALDEKAGKAEIVKAMNEALTYCDAVYDAQTVASLTEMVKSQGRGGVTNEIARGLSLFSNIAHNNEHYGNLVTYMRAKGVVPPSSEGR